MSLEALSRRFRDEQGRLNREAIRRLTEIFPLLNLHDIDRTAPGWVWAVEQATARHHAKTQAVAQDFYSDVRREVGVRSSVTFVFPDINGGKLRASLTYQGPYQAKRLLSHGRELEDVQRLLFGQTSGISLRHGMAGARDTIAATAERDQATEGRYGYVRLTAADPCGFCALKALTVYNSIETASQDYHDGDCRCVPVPRMSGHLPDGYDDRMAQFQAAYDASMATTVGKHGITMIDPKQTIRNMNRTMREINAGAWSGPVD